MDSVGPKRIMQGPMAGQTVSACIYRLPSGDWECELTGIPWNPRMEPIRHAYRFPNVEYARRQLEIIREAAEEMSQGPYVEPISA